MFVVRSLLCLGTFVVKDSRRLRASAVKGFPVIRGTVQHVRAGFPEMTMGAGSGPAPIECQEASADGDLDLAGLGRFGLGQRENEHAMLQLGDDFVLGDTIRKFELPEEIGRLEFPD